MVRWLQRKNAITIKNYIRDSTQQNDIVEDKISRNKYNVLQEYKGKYKDLQDRDNDRIEIKGDPKLGIRIKTVFKNITKILS